jgi:type I restriction enzyme S subunit
MVSEWRETTVGEFSPFSYGKGLPEHGRKASGSVPVFGSNGLVSLHDSPLTKGPTAVIGRKGTVGAVHYSSVPCWPIDTTFWVSEPDTETLRFKYYLLKSLGLDRMNSDSAVPGLNREAAHARRIVVPPLPQQRAIAHILGTLDDKIELNRRMNQTLEAMAQALFQNWFVDFAPFRDQGMQDSPLGEIPVGWRVGKLFELCKAQYGYTASAIEESVGPHLLRVMDINKQNWIEWDKVPYCEISDEDFTTYQLKIGDLVVVRMADPGKSAIIEQPIEAVFASYLVRLKTESLAHGYFVYGFLKSQAYADYCEGAMGGSSVQKSMNAKVIVDVELVIPPTRVLNEFLEYVLPLRKRLVANVEQSTTLAAIRDALLPRLLSGKIRIKDAEKFVEVKRCQLTVKDNPTLTREPELRT